MATVRVSIPKTGGGAGAPVPKNPNVIFVPVSDIKTMPEMVHGTVEVSDPLTLADSTKAIAVYLTSSTIKRKDTSEGDADARGYKSEFEGEHPGDSKEINDFLERHLNEGFIILSSECGDGKGVRMQGTPCNPMYLTVEEQDDNEAKKKTLKFAQSMRSPYKMRHYLGLLPDVAAVTPEAPPANEGGL